MVLTAPVRHTTVVTPPVQADRIGATVAQLDVLELVQSGALPAYPLDAPFGSAELHLHQAASSARTVIDITDLEGVPVARIAVEPSGQGLTTRGRATWLAARSSRPFEVLHLGPNDVGDHTGTVALCAPTRTDEVRAALDAAGPRPLLLALASLDGDLKPSMVETARQVWRLAAERRGAIAAIAPVPSTLGAAERNAIIKAYARGKPAVLLGTPTNLGSTPTAGTVLFLTGLSGSGKSTLARAIRNRLVEAGERVTLLDGDVVRRNLSAGLGFSAADRDTNIRRIGWVAAEVAHHGGIAICSPIAPFEETRNAIRTMAQSRGSQFLLIHVATPLEECERRDRKGLYAKARRGEIEEFTGISSPYEEPATPDLRLDTTGRDVDQLVDEILAVLDRSC